MSLFQVSHDLPAMDEPYEVTVSMVDGKPRTAIKSIVMTDEEREASYLAALKRELFECERTLHATVSKERYGPEELRHLTDQVHELNVEDARAAVEAVKAQIALVEVPKPKPEPTKKRLRSLAARTA